MKKYWKEVDRESWARINREIREIGPERTEITLVDLIGEPGELVYMYKYERYGKGSEESKPSERVYGYITNKHRGNPLAHLIRDITHEEFIELSKFL